MRIVACVGGTVQFGKVIRVNYPVTLWDRRNKDGGFDFNHLENGHSAQSAPTAKFPEQARSWNNAIWQKTFAHLVNGVVRLTA